MAGIATEVWHDRMETLMMQASPEDASEIEYRLKNSDVVYARVVALTERERDIARSPDRYGIQLHNLKGDVLFFARNVNHVFTCIGCRGAGSTSICERIPERHHL